MKEDENDDGVLVLLGTGGGQDYGGIKMVQLLGA